MAHGLSSHHMKIPKIGSIQGQLQKMKRCTDSKQVLLLLVVMETEEQETSLNSDDPERVPFHRFDGGGRVLWGGGTIQKSY
ncbi:hypothetical protein TNCV_4499171 [Trichonephila clavipes]|nr:hypothetical protein TNCV_4499171 [Trichonephila clavipes]